MQYGNNLFISHSKGQSQIISGTLIEHEVHMCCTCGRKGTAVIPENTRKVYQQRHHVCKHHPVERRLAHASPPSEIDGALGRRGGHEGQAATRKGHLEAVQPAPFFLTAFNNTHGNGGIHAVTLINYLMEKTTNKTITLV